MRILVIEDEKKTAAFLAKGLREAGFDVDVAPDGETGLEQARATKFDLLIVDIMLPHKDGWDVVAELRRDEVRTPILFLTARDSVRDRVKGLELGADDYLVKPFAFSELLARVRSVLRRAPQQQPEHLRIEDLELDTERHKATRSGVALNLTPKEFLLLAHLVRSSGAVVSRDEIAEHVWDVGFTTDTNVVDVVVRRLRSKVDDPFKTKLIHTIRGVGYVLKGALVLHLHLSSLNKPRSLHRIPAHSAVYAGGGAFCSHAGLASFTRLLCATRSPKTTQFWPTKCSP